jgi:pentatricopeptide repeat protein
MLFQQAVQCADSLAHVYLDRLLESSTSANFKNNGVAATSLIHPALHGWAKVQRDNPHCYAASRAEHLLQRLLHVHTVTGQRRLQPQIQTYNSVLDSFSKSAAPESPGKAREWLTHMQRPESLVSPDRISFNSVLNAYASRGDALHAMALFDQMKQQQDANPKLQPDKYTYSIVMKAWQRSKSPKAPHMTLRLLEELKHRYYVASHGRNSQLLRPNRSIYSIPMAMAGAQKAHKLLEEMLAWHQREPDNKDVAPDTSNFAICMNAYAKEGDAEKAEQLFMQLLDLNRAGYHNVQPNLRCFTILINAWCKQGGSIQRAQALLDRMEELFLDNKFGISGERINTFGYNSVMTAHVRSGNPGSADRVQELFDRMTRLGRVHDNPEMLPDKVSYTTLMQAWILERKPGFAQRVEDLLNEMNHSRQSSLKPDVVSYGCAIDAWTKSGERSAADRAEALLRQMQHLYKQGDKSLAPNDVCFNSIINAHSKAGNAEKAESILQWMEESLKEGNKGAKADAVSYSSCIDAWARSESVNAAAKSQRIFLTLVHKCKQGDQKCEPSGATFTSLMKALSKSKSPDVARLAKENLKVYQELGIRLNTIAFNALIHACSCSSGDAHDALELAITTFHTMRTNKDIGVDFITYNSLLHLVDSLISDDDERQAALEDVFCKCKEDGKVNEIILATIKRIASPSTLERLLMDVPFTGDETSRQ